MDIEQLVKTYPNDFDLGKKIRELYWEDKKNKEEPLKKIKNNIIYESPDGGNTVYFREVGTPVSERKILRKQLSILDNETDYK